MSRARETTPEDEKNLQKILKKLLTNYPERDIIKTFQGNKTNEKENSSQTRKELKL